MKNDEGLLAGSFASRQRSTRNILNPLLVLCGIVSPTCLLTSAIVTGTVHTVLWIAALVPPVYTLVAYTYWTFKEPNRLQSEEFVLQQRLIDTHAQIGDNRTGEVIDVAPSQSQLTANTASPEAR